jgi:TctA family transporter
MWIGNCFLLILNVPLVRFWLSIFKIPYSVLFPSILFFCCVGTYSVNNNLDDVLITAAFGLLGYILMRLSLDPAPLMLGFILGPMLEENFRRAMLLGRGSFKVFVTQPISATLLAFIAVLILVQIVSAIMRMRSRSPAPGPAGRLDQEAPPAAMIKSPGG